MKLYNSTAAFVCACLAMTPIASAAKNVTNESTAGEKKFSIAFINDIHAQLEPHPELFWDGDDAEREYRAGGLSRIASE